MGKLPFGKSIESSNSFVESPFRGFRGKTD